MLGPTVSTGEEALSGTGAGSGVGPRAGDPVYVAVRWRSCAGTVTSCTAAPPSDHEERVYVSPPAVNWLAADNGAWNPTAA